MPPESQLLLLAILWSPYDSAMAAAGPDVCGAQAVRRGFCCAMEFLKISQVRWPEPSGVQNFTGGLSHWQFFLLSPFMRRALAWS